MAESNLEQLKRVLDELFMFDRADLDFGLYRVMNLRRTEIRKFLDDDLLPRVREALGHVEAADKQAIAEERDKLGEQLRLAGVDPETSPKFRELQAEYDATRSLDADEADVFNHLTSFFRRYYKEGDFISLRRYKEGVYAIPYEGEEVKLHWANADQYYIKSTEQFRDYTFVVEPLTPTLSHEGRGGQTPSTTTPRNDPATAALTNKNPAPSPLRGEGGGEGEAGQRRVHFKLVEADTERNNNRAEAGRERRFLLAGDDPVAEVDGELLIRFEYRPDEDGRRQAAINEETVATVLGSPAVATWHAALRRDVRREGAKDELTLLAKHVNAYTAKNSFDYFVHKDLGGFLRRELDFYIKNEVVHLDDIDKEGFTATQLAQYLAKVRAIRAVGLPVIEFLASLEEFQKRLWLKKKFVVETHWCVTLDRVPRDLWTDIRANARQREEWVRLFAIDELRGALPPYTEPLTGEFLEANQHLVVDTSLFDRSFADRLLAGIDDLDETTDGLLIHSENFQALSLLQERYREQIACAYIDPPYNTGNDGFAYKDEYQHSSWVSMIEQRLTAARGVMALDGVHFASIDDTEQTNLRNALETVFGESNYLANVLWQKKYSPANDAKWFSDDHDFIAVAAVDRSAWFPTRLERDAAANSAYRHDDGDGRGLWRADNYTSNKSAQERPNLYYAIEHPLTGEAIWPSKQRVWAYSREQHERHVAEGRIWWGANGDARVPAYKRFLSDVGGMVPRTIWPHTDVGHNQDAVRDLQALFGDSPFTGLKPVTLLERVVKISGGDLVLDYFAGSGTTAHAVINLNREDGGRRKYILVEMGEYFDTVLKPRVLKAVYSKDWKDGKPVSREGVSQTIKVIRLESYEDTLNNLRVRETGERQASLLEQHKDLREQYMLRYWIDAETRGSRSLLDLDAFEDPFSYTLEVGQGSAAETRPVTVDLVETFNYLIGLRVRHVDTQRGLTLVRGTLPPRPGQTSGDRALVIWRNVNEVSAEDLTKKLDTLRINTRDLEFDVIYVNGDNHLENSRRDDETWKVRLIEEEFQRLMFETAERERK